MNNRNESWANVIASLSPAQRWVLVGTSAVVLGAVAFAIGKNGMLIVARGGTFAIGGAVKILAAAV